jgi:hypothetical protein
MVILRVNDGTTKVFTDDDLHLNDQSSIVNLKFLVTFLQREPSQRVLR